MSGGLLPELGSDSSRVAETQPPECPFHLMEVAAVKEEMEYGMTWV